jgi:High potential iron-sulfur protein
MKVGRRSILSLGIYASLAGAFLEGTAVLAAARCTDPDDLSGADLALRKSVEYTDSSSDDKTCRQCAFFKAHSDECGTCQIVTGLVSAGGHCTSWNARVKDN